MTGMELRSLMREGAAGTGTQSSSGRRSLHLWRMTALVGSGGLVAFNLDSINWAVGARMPLFEVVSVAGKCVGVRGYGGFLLGLLLMLLVLLWWCRRRGSMSEPLAQIGGWWVQDRTS